MRNRQRGVTAIGWVVLLTPFAIVGYAGMRLTPVYLNYMKVERALDLAATEAKNSGTTPQQLRSTIEKHFTIDVVDYPTEDNIKITREGTGWVIEAKYDDEAPLFANVSLHVAFDRIVHSGSPTAAGE